MAFSAWCALRLHMVSTFYDARIWDYRRLAFAAALADQRAALFNEVARKGPGWEP